MVAAGYVRFEKCVGPESQNNLDRVTPRAARMGPPVRSERW